MEKFWESDQTHVENADITLSQVRQARQLAGVLIYDQCEEDEIFKKLIEVIEKNYFTWWD